MYLFHILTLLLILSSINSELDPESTTSNSQEIRTETSTKISFVEKGSVEIKKQGEEEIVASNLTSVSTTQEDVTEVGTELDPESTTSNSQEIRTETSTKISFVEKGNVEIEKQGENPETNTDIDGSANTTESSPPVLDLSTTGSTILPELITTSKPFYHKTIEHLVKVVEENILGEDTVSEPPEITTTSAQAESNVSEARLDRLSDQIRAIISHYQKYRVVTVPDADIPDPMEVPDVKRSFGGIPTTFTTMKMYGLSNFTIAHINTDLNKMQVYVSVLMKQLMIIGNYSARYWMSRASGPFNVTLLDVETAGAAELQRTKDGILQASKSEMDMSFRDAIVDFKNTGLIGSLLQGVLASAAPVLFEAIKPAVLMQINDRIREDLNSKLKKIGDRIAVTGSRPPLDAAEDEARAYLLENGYDPYSVRGFTIKQNVFTVNITEFILKGLSNFRRVGEVVLAMDEGIVQIGLHVAALDLEGRCRWGVGIGENFRRGGYTNVTIDHMQIRALVNQSLDIKTKPILDNLDINVGKIKINMEGAGRFDIIVEVMVNTLPDIIRHVLVDAIEEPLKYKIQQLLNKIEPEVVLQKSLPELDNLGL